METFKSKYEEEKAQLIKIQADSDRRFSDERKTYLEQIETLERDNKKYLERINSIGSDLMSQNKQNKDTNKSINRIQNRIDELQADNKELTLKNEELKASYENISSQMIKYKKQEFALQHKVQELALKLQELEKAKIGFLLTEAEIKNIIRELNAVDETKERMLQIVNIDSRKTESNEAKRLDQLWVKLIEQEEEVISEYLSIALEDVITTPEVLQDKIDSLLDIELNLKAREVLVKMLYEKGYKANKLLG
jgi:chromosome segregation ATPase